jgi:hypothetical protein
LRGAAGEWHFVRCIFVERSGRIRLIICRLTFFF